MFNYLNILISVSFLISLLSFKLKNPIYWAITGIVFLTLVNEAIVIPNAEAQGLRNIVFYNIFSLADMLVWFSVFFMIHKKKHYRAIIISAFVVCVGYCLVELFVVTGWESFRTNSFRVYNICIIGFAILYFYEVLQRSYHNILLDPLFWIVSACFLYHSILFVTISIQTQAEFMNLPDALNIFFILQNTNNTFYYFLLSTSFIICYSNSSRPARA